MSETNFFYRLNFREPDKYQHLEPLVMSDEELLNFRKLDNYFSDNNALWSDLGLCVRNNEDKECDEVKNHINETEDNAIESVNFTIYEQGSDECNKPQQNDNENSCNSNNSSNISENVSEDNETLDNINQNVIETEQNLENLNKNNLNNEENEKNLKNFQNLENRNYINCDVNDSNILETENKNSTNKKEIPLITIKNCSDSDDMMNMNVVPPDNSDDQSLLNDNRNFDTSLEDKDPEVDNVKEVNIEDLCDRLKEIIKKADEDNLDMYNNYNYWYISPEMPLDPTIIDDGRQPVKTEPLEMHNITVCIFLFVLNF